MYRQFPLSGSPTWQDPVADVAALPVSGNTDGDARVTLDDSSIYIWSDLDDAWHQVSGGGGGGDSFYIWQADTGSITATSATDTASLLGDAYITTTADAMTDEITISLVPLSIDNAAVSLTAAIAYSKLALSGSIVNADISNSAAIAYSKLALAGSIVNADISTSAAIAVSKLAIGSALQQLRVNAGATSLEYFTPAASGDVVGPGSSTDDAFPTFNGTGGKTLQNTSVGTNAAGTQMLIGSSGRLYFDDLGTATPTYGIVRSSNTIQVAINSSSGGPGHFVFDTNGLLIGLGAQLQVGGTNIAPNSVIKSGDATSTTGGALTVRAGNMTGTGTSAAGALDVSGGTTTSSNTSSLAGAATFRAGNSTNASNNSNGALLTLSGGNVAGSGAGGNAIIQGGTSGSGAAGVVQIGRASTTNKNILNNSLGTPASDALTLGNGPTGTAGDPDGYLLITINGTDRYIPFWNA
jgi:hypothetical protein